MAKQTIVTTPAVAKDSGLGTPLADSFKMVNDNFTEVYAKPDLTLSTNTLTLTKADGSTDTVNLAPYLDGDITSIIAGNGLTGSSLDTGDATLNVVGGDGITVAADEVEATVDDSTIELSASNGSGALRVKDLGITTAKLAADAVTGAKIADDAVDSEHYTDGSIDTAHIADDGVTFAKLEPRYTGTTTITATSGNTNVDWSTSTVFKLNADCTGAKSFTFSAFKVGQVITFHNLKGSYTITLIATNGTFNKLGEKDYDGSKTNALMVECIDDSANPIFNYSVLTYTSDETP